MPNTSCSIKTDTKTYKEQVFKMLIKIPTATKALGDTTPHFANDPVLSIMTTESLN